MAVSIALKRMFIVWLQVAYKVCELSSNFLCALQCAF